MDLDKLFEDVYNNVTHDPKYYVIGMWLITEDYNKDGYIIDIMVCKGFNWQEAVEEAKDYENKIKKITDEKYLPLSVGKTVLEATKNSNKFYDLLAKKELLPDDEEILKIVEDTIEMDVKLGC